MPSIPIPRDQTSPYGHSQPARDHSLAAIRPDQITPPGHASPFALSIAAAVQATGGALSRTRMFALIRDGEVDARKVGRRTVVIASSLWAYIERQPSAGPTTGSNGGEA